MTTVKRVLDSEIWLDDSFVELTIFERYLFIGLIAAADHDGTMDASPGNIRTKALPFDAIQDRDIITAIDHIEIQGFITRLGSRLIINNWTDFAYAVNWARIEAWARLKQSIFGRDSFTCVYCGQPAQEIDHIHPKSKGGRDESCNLVASCVNCNRSKRDNLLGDWYPQQLFFNPDSMAYIEAIASSDR